ncbi:hypothetical protein ABGT92_04220 [Streptomyces cinereoruber]|uniref:hypothetical protein n=1 Tax=Streptomyces cinereoruber TaxID=67260 RepID=UPI00345D4D46
MPPVNLRVVALGAAVTAAVLLPLVATAEPAGEDGSLWKGLGSGPRTPEATVPEISAGTPSEPPAVAPAPSVSPDPPAPAVSERVARCGPELASPGGVEAQTCVLNEGVDVWARAYYRNATGQELDAFLTLMAPGGRTVQVRCAVPAQDEPGTCETPRERGAGTVAAYTGVAEFAGADEAGSTPLLLRAGSNTTDREGS